jgi:riboflavin kinase / FMN adenylyltransferase
MTTFPAIRGMVIAGDKVGRTIGFPTANLKLEIESITLEPGVYLGTCEVNQQTYSCLPYFGPRSVMGETKNCFEVYIYDFDQDIYGEQLTVRPQHFIRPPLQLNSLAELKAQLEADKAAGLELIHKAKTAGE